MITDVDCWILKLLMSVINIEQTCINTVALIKHYSSFEHYDHSDTGLTNGASLRQAIWTITLTSKNGAFGGTEIKPFSQITYKGLLSFSASKNTFP